MGNKESSPNKENKIINIEIEQHNSEEIIDTSEIVQHMYSNADLVTEERDENLSPKKCIQES